MVGSRGGVLEIEDHRDPESTVKSRRETLAVNNGDRELVMWAIYAFTEPKRAS